MYTRQILSHLNYTVPLGLTMAGIIYASAATQIHVRDTSPRVYDSIPHQPTQPYEIAPELHVAVQDSLDSFLRDET